MSLYHYKAVGKKGIIQLGIAEAPSSAELKIHIQGMGLSLITYSRDKSLFFSRKVKPWVLMDLCLHLEQFENAGIPLKDSLKNLYHIQTVPKLKLVLKQVIKDVEGGVLFSKALSKHPAIFDPVFLGLITAGEKTGHFSFVLQHLFQHLKWVDDVQAKTSKALRYPCIMASVLFSIIIILITVLVPELVKFMEAFAKELPFSTRCLIFLSNFLLHHSILLFFTMPAIFLLSFGFFKLHPKGPSWKNRFYNILPFIGSLRNKIALSRFCHLFALMFKSGIDVIQALQTAGKELGPGQMSQGLQDVECFIKEGLSLSQAFEKVELFPPLVIQMVKVGEQTSSLERSLFHVKDYFDTILKRQVEHTIGLLEPLMILCMGGIMVWIIYALFLPLYDTLSVLEP